MILSCKYSCFHQHIKPISIILMSLTTALNPFLRFKSSTVGGAKADESSETTVRPLLFSL